jgi:hypothetical protein
MNRLFTATVAIQQGPVHGKFAVSVARNRELAMTAPPTRHREAKGRGDPFLIAINSIATHARPARALDQFDPPISTHSGADQPCPPNNSPYTASVCVITLRSQ